MINIVNTKLTHSSEKLFLNAQIHSGRKIKKKIALSFKFGMFKVDLISSIY